MPINWERIKELVLENHGSPIVEDLKIVCSISECPELAVRLVRIPMGSGHTYCTRLCEDHLREVCALTKELASPK